MGRSVENIFSIRAHASLEEEHVEPSDWLVVGGSAIPGEGCAARWLLQRQVQSDGYLELRRYARQRVSLTVEWPSQEYDRDLGHISLVETGQRQHLPACKLKIGAGAYLQKGLSAFHFVEQIRPEDDTTLIAMRSRVRASSLTTKARNLR